MKWKFLSNSWLSLTILFAWILIIGTVFFTWLWFLCSSWWTSLRISDGPCLVPRPPASSSSFAASCCFKPGGKEHLQPFGASFVTDAICWGFLFSKLQVLLSFTPLPPHPEVTLDSFLLPFSCPLCFKIIVHEKSWVKDSNNLLPSTLLHGTLLGNLHEAL